MDTHLFLDCLHPTRRWVVDGSNPCLLNGERPCRQGLSHAHTEHSSSKERTTRILRQKMPDWGPRGRDARILAFLGKTPSRRSPTHVGKDPIKEIPHILWCCSSSRRGGGSRGCGGGLAQITRKGRSSPLVHITEVFDPFNTQVFTDVRKVPVLPHFGVANLLWWRLVD